MKQKQRSATGIKKHKLKNISKKVITKQEKSGKKMKNISKKAITKQEKSGKKMKKKLSHKNDKNSLQIASERNTTVETSPEINYVLCPVEKKFITLFTFMKKFIGSKVLIITGSSLAQNFYYDYMNYENCPISCINENQERAERDRTHQKFLQSTSGILLCTEAASRKLKTGKLDWLIQYDPPHDINNFIKVLKTASSNETQCLLFLCHEEFEFVRYLKDRKLTVEPFEIIWSKVFNIEAKLQKLMKEKYAIYLSSRLGYGDYVRSYSNNPNKDLFDISKLSLTNIAKNFGFTVPPRVDLTSPAGKDEEMEQNFEGNKPKRPKLRVVRTFRHISK